MSRLALRPAGAQPSGQDQPQADPEREAEEARRAMDVFLRREKLTFRKGEGSLELDAFYATDKGTDFVPFDDTRDLATITTRLISWSVIARYGLIDNLELDLIIPFGYAKQEVDLGFTRSSTDDFGLGDIAGRLRYQLWQERGAIPDIILDFDVKSRSGGDNLVGSGHWSVGAAASWPKHSTRSSFLAAWVQSLFTLSVMGAILGTESSTSSAGASR